MNWGLHGPGPYFVLYGGGGGGALCCCKYSVIANVCIVVHGKRFCVFILLYKNAFIKKQYRVCTPKILIASSLAIPVFKMKWSVTYILYWPRIHIKRFCKNTCDISYLPLVYIYTYAH